MQQENRLQKQVALRKVLLGRFRNPMPQSQGSARAKKKTKNSRSFLRSSRGDARTEMWTPRNIASQITGVFLAAPISALTPILVLASVHPMVRNHPTNPLMKGCPIIRVLYPRPEDAIRDLTLTAIPPIEPGVSLHGRNTLMTATWETNPDLTAQGRSLLSAAPLFLSRIHWDSTGNTNTLLPQKPKTIPTKQSRVS